MRCYNECHCYGCKLTLQSKVALDSKANKSSLKDSNERNSEETFQSLSIERIVKDLVLTGTCPRVLGSSHQP